MLEKLVVVTRKTRLTELIERFNTRAQARFYIEHAGGDFADYQREDDVYRRSLDAVVAAAEVGLKMQVMDRGLVPTCLFTERDAVITVGQDGLVANTAKYVLGRPLLAVNPDPSRFDGVLLPFSVAAVRPALERVVAGTFTTRAVTLAQVRLADGQTLLGFNDLFLGAASHVSARYTLKVGGQKEPQSSSGILVSTGAGSTGWLSSTFNMAAALCRLQDQPVPQRPQMRFEDPRLMFVVREPFQSRATRIGLTAGLLEAGQSLTVESMMPQGGVIFSDGVEADRLQFNAGAVATIQAAPEHALLVQP